jgi:hypothetical protein
MLEWAVRVPFFGSIFQWRMPRSRDARQRNRRLIGNQKPAIWESGGPARTRTEDQGIHSAPPFPEGVDYLFTPVGCGTL